MSRPALAACMLIASLALAACWRPPVNRAADLPPPTAQSVDLNAYLGKWYEIARYENRFENDCYAVTAEYSLRDDGRIRVLNRCHKGAPDGEVKDAVGRARIVDGSNGAKLKVSFFGPFWGDYWVLDHGPDYEWSLVGEPSGRYLWILSRTPQMDDAALKARVAELRDMGYDTDALYFTPQPDAGQEAPPPAPAQPDAAGA